MIRLLEVLLHAGDVDQGLEHVKQIHAEVLEAVQPERRALRHRQSALRSAQSERPRPDPAEREPGRYAWRLSGKGQRVAILSSFCFIKGCTAPSPGASSTISRNSHTGQNKCVNWSRLITKPITPLMKLSAYSVQLDLIPPDCVLYFPSQFKKVQAIPVETRSTETTALVWMIALKKMRMALSTAGL